MSTHQSAGSKRSEDSSLPNFLKENWINCDQNLQQFDEEQDFGLSTYTQMRRISHFDSQTLRVDFDTRTSNSFSLIGELLNQYDQNIQTTEYLMERRKNWKKQIRQKLMINRQLFLTWIDQFTQMYLTPEPTSKMTRTSQTQQFSEGLILQERLAYLRSKIRELNTISNRLASFSFDVSEETISEQQKEIESLKGELDKLQQEYQDQNEKISRDFSGKYNVEKFASNLLRKMVEYFDYQVGKKTGSSQSSSASPRRQPISTSHKSTMTGASYFSQGTQTSVQVQQIQQPSLLRQFSGAENLQRNVNPFFIPTTIPLPEDSFLQTLDDNDEMKCRQISELSNIPHTFDHTKDSILLTLEKEKKEEAKVLKGSNFIHNARKTLALTKFRKRTCSSIYYLKPESSDIYFLDFQHGKFFKEQLLDGFQLPFNFTSQQLANGDIFIIGGMEREDKLSNYVLQIRSQNLEVWKKYEMRLKRFNVPCGLLRNRYILACGGITMKKNEKKLTNECDMFDTQKNKWIKLPNMKFERANTSISVLGSRYAYIFQGRDQSEGQATLEFLDFGDQDKYKVPSQWRQLSIRNYDLGDFRGFGTYPISFCQILIFGSDNQSTYILDLSSYRDSIISKDVKLAMEVEVEKMREVKLNIKTNFCDGVDYQARDIGNCLYALDYNNMDLHIFSFEHEQWVNASLKQLGIKE